jgi:hypothetical protein
MIGFVYCASWRSAGYLRRIKKQPDDKCWFCRGESCVTRSPLPRPETGHGYVGWRQDPGSVRVLLSNPRWERRLVKFLELSGVGRRMADGTNEDEARGERMDGWIVWETVQYEGRTV